MPTVTLATEREVKMEKKNCKKNTKTGRIILCCVLAIGVIIAAAAVISDDAPDLSKKSPEEIREYFQSAQFRELAPEKRRQVARKTFEPRRQEFQKQMFETAREYCELPPERKTAYLDKRIDDMQKRFAEMRTRRVERRASGGTGQSQTAERTVSNSNAGNREPNPQRRMRGRRGGGGSGRRRGPSPERIRGRMERMDPKHRAYMTQFREDMAKRMEQRGIEMPFGRGRRGRR